jgi:hypothetical protein
VPPRLGSEWANGLAGGLQLRVIADPVVSSFSPMAFSALGGQVPLAHQ